MFIDNEGGFEIFVWEGSGRRAEANRGLVSVDAAGRLYDGYDSSFVDEEKLTPQERTELADFMIARWTAFKSPVIQEAA